MSTVAGHWWAKVLKEVSRGWTFSWFPCMRVMEGYYTVRTTFVTKCLRKILGFCQSCKSKSVSPHRISNEYHDASVGPALHYTIVMIGLDVEIVFTQDGSGTAAIVEVDSDGFRSIVSSSGGSALLSSTCTCAYFLLSRLSDCNTSQNSDTQLRRYLDGKQVCY